MSEVNGAGALPAEADVERAEIERIKELLREKLRGQKGTLLGAQDRPTASGNRILDEVRELVTKEIADVANEGNPR